MERVCRPDSVRRGNRRDDHSSGRPGTRSLEPSTRTLGRAALCDPWTARVPIRCCSGWGLACRPCRHVRGELLPHLFTLAVGTGEPAPLGRCAFCSTFRRLGPCGLLRLAVSQHRALRSPDLPPATTPARRGRRSPDPLRCEFYDSRAENRRRRTGHRRCCDILRCATHSRVVESRRGRVTDCATTRPSPVDGVNLNH